MARTAAPKARRRGTSKARSATVPASGFHRVARPDAIDFRDRPYRPMVSSAPAPMLYPRAGLAIKNQGDSNACTGFGLSVVVEYLLRSAKREARTAISPYMLYSMARRYDEFPGSNADEGSSLRGALKGWFKHGACSLTLFPALDMPPAADSVEHDWWFDAVQRPLGAYYRVEPKNIADMHAALHEVGVLYASAGCHAGWDAGLGLKPLQRRPASIDAVWNIPVEGGHAKHPGHAFAIVGYNRTGFLIQNSWGPQWGSHGYAILSYDDWLRNAMDCWVAQLGVVTDEHREIARSGTLRSDAAGRVALAASEVLRNRELSPFIINMANNGALSNSGAFRTTPDDVRAIVDVQLERARRDWGLGDRPVDVCIYAHGGLVDEAAAANVAAKWIPMLYEQHVFPVFLMWETGFVETLTGLLEDALAGVPRTTGAGFGFERWWNQRIERALARPGTALWGEMKQNADWISLYRERYGDGSLVADDDQAGAVLLYRHFKHQVANKQVRMHFVGHSAGSIVGSFMLDRLLADQLLRFESVSFMAPAVRLDTFTRLLQPHLASGSVKRYQQFHLSDRAEEDDPSCGLYRRSLLYLVSESFEGGTTTPILGMQKFFDAIAGGLQNTLVHVAPGPSSAATTHGAFDDDALTQAQVLRFILGH
jgi:Papain family cysteine protease